MESDFLREKIKELRKTKKINYTYFSEKLKMNKHSFYNFMCGTRNLSQEKLTKLETIIRRIEDIEL